jgi:hypothetical protein
VEVAPGVENNLSIYVMNPHGEPLPLNASQLKVSYGRVQDGATHEKALECTPQKLEGFKCLLPKDITLRAGDQINVQTAPEAIASSTIQFAFPFSSYSSRR